MLTASLLAFLIAAAVATAARHPVRRTGGMPAPRAVSRDRTHQVVRSSGLPRPARNDYWHRRFLAMRHLAYMRGVQVKRLQRAQLATRTVREAINLACVVYGNCATLWRRARCESTLQADPPHNNESRGLFQFKPSTFASTPFRGFDILSPYANALAAGWMMGPAHRGDEWACS